MIILILEIAAGIAAYYFMKKKLTEKYSESFVKSVKWMLISPIVQVLVFVSVCTSALMYTQVIDEATRARSGVGLSSLFGSGLGGSSDYSLGSRYTESLMESPAFQDVALSALVTMFVGLVAAVLFVIMAIRQFRGIFGKGSENRLKTAHKVTLITTYAVQFSLAWRTISVADYAYHLSDDTFKYGTYIGLLIVVLVLGTLSDKFMKNASLFFEQREADMTAKQAATEQPSPAATPSSSKVEQLQELKNMLDQGILTQEEFDNEKRKLLNQ